MKRGERESRGKRGGKIGKTLSETNLLAGKNRRSALVSQNVVISNRTNDSRGGGVGGQGGKISFAGGKGRVKVCTGGWVGVEERNKSSQWAERVRRKRGDRTGQRKKKRRKRRIIGGLNGRTKENVNDRRGRTGRRN